MRSSLAGEATAAVVGVAGGGGGLVASRARWPGTGPVQLAGHVLVATARLEAVLAEEPRADPTVVDLAGFYGPNRVDEPGQADAGLHAAHPGGRRRRRRDPGPDAVAAELRAVLDRLRAVLPAADPDRLVSVVNVRHGATPLDAYLRSRVVELVVHGDDLAASVGLAYEVPPAAAEVTLQVCLELARARSGDLAAIRAFTRRERAEPDALRVL